jgi:hypothetical protein
MNMKNWFFDTPFTFFLIGFLTANGIVALGQRDYVWGVIDIGLATLNYYLYKVGNKNE